MPFQNVIQKLQEDVNYKKTCQKMPEQAYALSNNIKNSTYPCFCHDSSP